MSLRTTIFLRSYAGDLRWVPLALRSIHRFVTDVCEIIICVPANDYGAFKALNLTREVLVSSKLEPMRDDYCGQQADKLLADLHTESEYIVFWDSDVIAIRPLSPQNLMIDGKPRCIETPFDKLVDANGNPATPWKPVVERALGHPVAKERMRQHVMMTHRDALVGLRDYFLKVHHVSVVDYIASVPNREFSEFNILHSWAAHHRPDLFHWWDTEELGVPEPFVKQFWSWSGITEDERRQIEEILK